MIYTRFGTEVEIIKGDIETGEVDIKRKKDGKIFWTYIHELKADFGISEIFDAIDKTKVSEL